MNIREAASQDMSELSALAVLLSEKYVTPELPQSAAVSFLESLKPDRIGNNLQNGFQYHVAEEASDIIGFIGIKDNKHLYHLFVSDDYQRKGIARQLWYVAKRACIANGNREGFTVNASLYAKPVYEKFGFVPLSGPQEKNGVIFVPMKLEVSK